VACCNTEIVDPLYCTGSDSIQALFQEAGDIQGRHLSKLCLHRP